MSTEEPHEELVEVLEEEFIENCNADVDTTCTICQAEFLDPDDLTVHLQQIHKIRRAGSRLCYFCTHKYTDFMEFAEHFRDNHLTSIFFCLHCLRAFSDEDEHRTHEKEHTRSFKSAHCCSQCSERFGNTRDLRKHDLDKHNNNDDGVMIQPLLPYLSVVLNIKAETVLLSLRTDAVYICVSCNYSTSSIKHFIEHSKTRKCSVMVCDKCSNVYKKKYSLNMHVTKYCGKIYNYMRIECPDCKLVFNKYTLKEHKKSCKVIKCYTCNTYYDTMYELSEHQSTEHPLSVELKACTFCWKQCVGSVALQKHMDRSHKSELHLYKYMCVICKIPFKHPQKLFGHLFSKHKDIEPYTCRICNKNFRIRKQFTLHIKLEHKSIGFVEFDENYHVFFSDKKSENPFIPKSLFVDKQKQNAVLGKNEESNISLQDINSEIGATETEGNQTEAETAKKPMLKRKRGLKGHNKDSMQTIAIESSDDESLLVIKKRVLKQQKSMQSKLTSKVPKKQTVNNRMRFTCKICNKYCYTFQNYNHHISLHSKKDFKKCIKCSRYFRSKDKLKKHMEIHHSSSKLTDTLKYMLEKRKKGESITSDIPMSEKFRRTIQKVKLEESKATATITEVDNTISVQKFIENFTPEAESKPDIIIHHAVTLKLVKGVPPKEPAIKMTKFEVKPMPLTTKLAMPVKFKTGQCERVTASIKLLRPIPVVQETSQDSDSQNYDNDNYMDRNDSIPEVAEEVMLEGTEETPKAIQIPHKIVIPKVLTEYKDLRIAHLQPQAPFYRIVKVNEVIDQQNNRITIQQNEPKEKKVDIKLPDGTKLVSSNPLAHLLGKTPIEKVLEPMKNKYYKPKVRDFKSMLTEALINLDTYPIKKRTEPASGTGSQVEN